MTAGLGLIRRVFDYQQAVFKDPAGRRYSREVPFYDNGTLISDRAQDWGKAQLDGLDRNHMLEYAGHGPLDVEQFLLTKHPDLTVREPIRNNSALEAAEYGKHHTIAAQLRPLFKRAPRAAEGRYSRLVAVTSAGSVH